LTRAEKSREELRIPEIAEKRREEKRQKS